MKATEQCFMWTKVILAFQAMDETVVYLTINVAYFYR